MKEAYEQFLFCSSDLITPEYLFSDVLETSRADWDQNEKGLGWVVKFEKIKEHDAKTVFKLVEVSGPKFEVFQYHLK